MAAILRDSVVARTHPRAIPLGMIIMKKIHSWVTFLSSMSMGLRLATLRATGAPLKMQAVLGRQRSMRRPWKLATRTRHWSLFVTECSVFFEELFGKNRALYVYLTFKDVDRFRKESVHELCCLKASRGSKVHARDVLVR